MKEKASFQLLQVIAIYGAINLVAVFLALYFKPNFYPYVALGGLILMVGWFQFCILQCRVHYYESLIEQRNLLWDFARKSPAITARLKEVKKTISDFEKSFPLTTKIVKLLEGKK